MLHSLPSYFEALAFHMADVMTEAQQWSASLLAHVVSFQQTLQDMARMVAAGRLCSMKSQDSLNSLWFDLQTLELTQTGEEINGQLEIVRKLLAYVSQVIEHHILDQVALSLHAAI